MISASVSVRFAELFEGAASRSEVVCTFLALLELIRLKQIACRQPAPFAEIEISRAALGASPAKLRRPLNRPWSWKNIRNPTSPIRRIFHMELKFILESLLFSAQKPMSVKELRDVLANAAIAENTAKPPSRSRKPRRRT